LKDASRQRQIVEYLANLWSAGVHSPKYKERSHALFFNGQGKQRLLHAAQDADISFTGHEAQVKLPMQLTNPAHNPSQRKGRGVWSYSELKHKLPR